ncbi:hypothetical protein [Sulfurimonas sp. HSL-1716]|uniref:hypothetical protein n=1 Tax=Hydrocurvibacter sulfurireducens TaxID=3131937 RepID=UPI0031F855C3
MRFTIDEYSKQFKMSKEMINSKLRSKKLNYIIENGTTYIIVTRSSLDQEKREEIHQHNMQKKSQETASNITTKKTTVGMILSLYQRENAQLKQKIKELEKKIDSLVDDKEQMLRDERDRIETIYASKDEQLKTILELINKKFLLEQKTETVHEVSLSELDTINASIDDNFSFVELKHYLKTLDIEPYQRKIIKRRFLDAREHDIRVIEQNGKIYLDFAKYDYSDLLKY